MSRTPNPALPARHPDEPVTVPVLGPLVKLLGIKPATDEQWQEIGEALTRSDEPMDALVNWMYQAGMGTARPLFERALNDGIDSIPNAPEQLRAFFEGVETAPKWVDWEQIRLGQRTFQSTGVEGIYLARDVSFLGGFVASGINRTLVLTKSGKAGATGGGQRFAETMKWALDVIGDGGLQRGGLGYRSTLHVRLIHTFVRRHLERSPEWRPEEWGVPINQSDMGATMLGALHAPVVVGLLMGKVFTPRELDAVAHVARYAGWLMGIEEAHLPHDFRDATVKLYHYLTALSVPDETSRLLARPMAEDPLHWHYPNFAPVRRRIAWAQHLSITTAYTGRTRMRQLGLPAYIPPWYPALRIPVNLLRSGLALAVPGGRDRQARAGLRRQHAFMRTLVGTETDTRIGGVTSGVDHAA
ncbi:oxygenase MpaB family protein [Nocardia arthritidis]|nr:oxygenase MpaB family protein [Nocardia arthritidis]